MGKLSELPNIGAVLEQRLAEVGVETPEQLCALGAKEALIRLRLRDPGACLHELCALEGAIRGVRKQDLPADVREELRIFHKSL